MNEVGGNRIGTHALVTKSTSTERDLYGGAVHLEIHVAGGMASIDLDPDGVEKLIVALNGHLAESRADYDATRREAQARAL